ncbi:MAG: hypothetical protein ACI4SC_00365, partial [Candidatus Neoclostridium sp.]
DGLVPAGYNFASEGFENSPLPLPEIKSAPCAITQNGRYFTVNCGALTYTIDAGTGVIESVEKDGESVFGSKLALNIYRAPIDNDRWVKSEWKSQKIHEAYQDAYSVTQTGENRITVAGKVAAHQREPIVKFTLNYDFNEDGVAASVEYEYNQMKEGWFLPRFGFVTTLGKEYDEIEFYGYGPQESYIDKRYACSRDLYKTTVGDNFVHYINPQENGNHYGTTYARIGGGKHVVELVCPEGCSFNLSPYDAKTLEQTAHDDQLPESDKNYFYIDYFMSGAGSNSCGPRLNEKYRTPQKGSGKIQISVK